MSQGVPGPTLTPHLIVSDGAKAIDFYKKAFNAVELMRMDDPNSGTLMHACLQIGNSKLMLAGEFNCESYVSKSPLTLKGTPVIIHMDVPNVDEAFKHAIAAGAKETMPPADMFWGDRYGKLVDPFGHEWSLATKIRDLSPEEIAAAAKEAMASA